MELSFPPGLIQSSMEEDPLSLLILQSSVRMGLAACTNPHFCVAITPHSDDIHKAVKEFMTNCVKMTGVVPIIVITNKTSGDFMEAEKMFKLKGAEVVISIENYTKNDHIKTQGKTNDILMVIHRALRDVKYRLRQERNPQKEWRVRKKFMLDYIHNADLEEKEEERKRKEERNHRRDRREPQMFRSRYTHYVDLEKEEDEKRQEEEEWRRAEERYPGRDSLEMDKYLVEHRHMGELEKTLDELRVDARRIDEERAKTNPTPEGDGCLIL
ncbi:uncharacterized protein LOC143784196 [Ranitomeya variabilis]|uniref:uncharacterized protein LOC143784196 n=1 Tax=Ranitomeya variabilis TaxID=490064 RepID=UPI0040572670